MECKTLRTKLNGILEMKKSAYPASSYTLWPPLPKRLTPTSLHRVVVAVAAVVRVKELLEPLQKLKVVLELGLHQLVNLDALKDFEGHQGEMLWSLKPGRRSAS